MKLTNPFIGYVTRSYLQIKQDVLTKFQSRVPEITDHTDTNPWVKGISIWASVAEMLGYYIDASAREVFLETATQFSSMVKLARFFDYRIRGVIASTVDVTFYVDAPAAADIIIPTDTVVKTNDNIEFRTVAVATILTGENEVTVSAIQHTKVVGVNLGVSDGAIGQLYPLEAGVVDNSIVINVDGTIFTPVDTFAFEDTDDNTFVAGLNESRVMEVKFGDGVNGAVPASGKTILADYYVSGGAAGKVAANTITQVVTPVTTPGGVILRVTNDFGAAGGTDADNINDLKKKIPLSIRTQSRAVTRQDYIDIASLAPGVGKAGVVFNCGKVVELFIVPAGGGIASAQLKANVEAYFEDFRMMTTKVKANGAGEVNLIVVAELYVLPNFVRSTVLAAAKQNMLDYLSGAVQEVGGNVQIGNLYQVMEGTAGVDYSKLIRLVAIPFARATSGEVALNFTVETLETSMANAVWQVKVVTATEYELFKDNGYLGTYTFGTEIVKPEAVFTILDGAYEVGNAWEFVTYPYNDAITLQEPSVPVTKLQYLDFKAFGGL